MNQPVKGTRTVVKRNDKIFKMTFSLLDALWSCASKVFLTSVSADIRTAPCYICAPIIKISHLFWWVRGLSQGHLPRHFLVICSSTRAAVTAVSAVAPVQAECSKALALMTFVKPIAAVRLVSAGISSFLFLTRAALDQPRDESRRRRISFFLSGVEKKKKSLSSSPHTSTCLQEIGIHLWTCAASLVRKKDLPTFFFPYSDPFYQYQ